jgi:hypothetical protein
MHCPLPSRAVACCLALALIAPRCAWSDGKVVPPRDYAGSLEETAQEAIIIFHGSDEPGRAVEDLILKIHVEGDADRFAWIVPLPGEPKIAKEDAKLFKELFRYVELRNRSRIKSNQGATRDAEAPAAGGESVEVLSRQTVGDFDIAVVREHQQGGLNPWLESEGFQTLDDAEDILRFYREKEYVFSCIKVSSEALASARQVESHPLRFTFSTGGRDGIYFPMKMTGLQQEPFDVNLYVFYRFWINDKLSPYGYRHRGFHLRHRDWDTAKCVPDGGKSYSLPAEDPFLSGMAHHIPTVTRLFQKLHPGQKYYLTNIQARQLRPPDVRQWADDLWLFPYYTDKGMVPYDARPGGPAAAAYPDAETSASSGRGSAGPSGRFPVVMAAVLTITLVLAAGGLVWRWRTGNLARTAEAKKSF